jgi:hypothetical protein
MGYAPLSLFSEGRDMDENQKLLNRISAQLNVLIVLAGIIAGWIIFAPK